MYRGYLVVLETSKLPSTVNLVVLDYRNTRPAIVHATTSGVNLVVLACICVYLPVDATSVLAPRRSCTFNLTRSIHQIPIFTLIPARSSLFAEKGKWQEKER